MFVFANLVSMPFALNVHAQNPQYGWNWHFGLKNVMEFGSGEPQLFSTSSMSLFPESPVSISHPLTGELLFYSNGYQIWNARHQIMPNGSGLFGNATSTQGALAVPDPGDSSRFYLITVDLPSSLNGGDDRGINFTLIDMNLDDGFGDVIEKNIPLYQDTVTEKLAATPHANGRDYWIIAHEWGNNTFLIWLLTDSGFGEVKKISLGNVHDYFASSSQGRGYEGQLKISPNGRLMAIVEVGAWNLEICDFDNRSGLITNPRTLFATGDDIHAYGMSFSPGSCFLYTNGPDDRSALFQYDVRFSDIDSIRNSRVQVGGGERTIGFTGGFHAPQLGPDGKIYISRTQRIGVVKHPDNKGIACGYDPDFMETEYIYFNFPNFIDAWFGSPDCGNALLAPFTSDTLICIDQTVSIRAPWVGWTDNEFDVEAKVAELIERTDTTFLLRYREPGSHTVKIRWSDPINGADSAVGTITVHPLPRAAAIPDTAICNGQSITIGDPLNETDSAIRYTWEPATGLDDPTSLRPLATPLSSTTYTLLAVDMRTGCLVRDTVKVTLLPAPLVDAGPDNALCGGASIRLTAYSFNPGAGNRYRWTPSTGLDCDTCFAVTARPDASTTYRVTITNEFGCTGVDSVRVTVLDAAATLAADDTAVCAGIALTLGRADNPGGLTYRWEPAAGLDDPTSPSPTITTLESMTWRVTATDVQSGCTAVDSVSVVVHPLPVVDAGEERSICVGGETTIGSGKSIASLDYYWTPTNGLDDPRSLQTMARPAKTTTYLLRVVDLLTGCAAIDSVTIIVHEPPIVEAGEDAFICVGESVRLGDSSLNGTSGDRRLAWTPEQGLDYPTSPAPTARPDRTTLYTLRTIDTNGCVGTDSVMVVVDEPRLVRAFIGREYSGSSDEPIAIAVEMESVPAGSGIDSIEIALRYDGSIMIVDTDEIDVDGTMLDGWTMTIVDAVPGALRMRLTAPVGRELVGSGDLLHLIGRMYLGRVLETELAFDIEAEGRCLSFIEEPGRVRHDSICGLSFRLIEYGLGKYAAPRAVPNPAESVVNIEFGIGLDGPTRLEVYDAAGRRVALLVDEMLQPGTYGVSWPDAPSGSYLIRMTSGTFSEETWVVVK